MWILFIFIGFVIGFFAAALVASNRDGGIDSEQTVDGNGNKQKVTIEPVVESIIYRKRALESENKLAKIKAENERYENALTQLSTLGGGRSEGNFIAQRALMGDE